MPQISPNGRSIIQTSSESTENSLPVNKTPHCNGSSPAPGCTAIEGQQRPHTLYDKSNVGVAKHALKRFLFLF